MVDFKVCPYPGLRPFNENETIYFKGRDEQIKKIVQQLQDKKFLMLTGASGDGKSSLIYAGLVPNAKAGFFKARFNNWIVSDFRPERTPFKNMVKALSMLCSSDPKEFEQELGYGFSALIDTYKASPFYFDDQSESWTAMDEKSQKEKEKKGANLLIIVDQFEEFFTYPENYSNDQVSLESQKVLNLLLETSVIAQKKNIPIYIVCTMRSDYIGQCASFRGLPEAIGYSQFFVPRLKREEIQQVIEEPAKLNGIRISRRLAQKLLNILPVGFDQLPLLQHALNQIWKAARNGEEEMDIIHLAMVGGISSKQLTKSDKIIFDSWYETLSAFKKQLLENPSMGNILNAHAREIFEVAADRMYSKSGLEISKEKAQFIIQMAFCSLTKIDALRAVRNRMSLEEIKNIINLPDADTTLIGELLDVFRMPGSTFLRPFIDDEGSEKLKPDNILDITHESLIRNWDILKEWTDREYENYQTFLDFDKQLQRWIINNESKDYLLPGGPLSFFEKWYQTCQPNKYWLLKHDENKFRYNKNETKAAIKIEEIKNFLNESRSSIRKKRRTLIISVITFVCLLSSFTVWAVIERSKAISQQEVADRLAMEAVASKEEALRSKEKAIESEKFAVVAQQQSKENESKAVQAGQQSRINENLAIHAKEQALLAQNDAMLSKRKAEQEALNAEKQRLISETEKVKAEKAEKKAKQLTVLSIAQNLALKTSLMNGSENQQLQGLLALQAYLFTKKNDGDILDPAIYGAVLTSFAALTKNKLAILNGSEVEARTLAISHNNNIVSAGKNGKIETWDAKTGKIVNTLSLKYKSPFNFIVFGKNENLIISGHENKVICFWDLSQDPLKLLPIELIGHTGYIRDAKVSPDGKTIAAVGKDSLLITWDVSTSKITQTYNLKSFARALVYTPDGNEIVTANEDGSINRVKLNDGTIEKMHNSPGFIPLSLIVSPLKKLIIAGFSSGKIKLFNLADNTFHQINDPDPLIDVERIALSAEEDLMAVASSDKKIKIYSLAHPDRKPLLLKDHKSKVKSLTFTKENILVAGCEDKTIHTWLTSTNDMAEQLCEYLKRNLTQEEWNQYIGNNMEYEKTCSGLH